MDASRTIGLLFVATGIIFLGIGLFRRSRGKSLLVFGLSLAIGGLLSVWTGILWLTLVAVGPTILFRGKR